MNHFTTLLYNLDELYHAGNLETYEECLQEVCQQVQQSFPGCTIAYAEIYIAGAERTLQGGMRHVLLPTPEGRSR